MESIRYAWTYNARGDTYDRMGDYDRALADYNRAIELTPNISTSFFKNCIATSIGVNTTTRCLRDRMIKLNPQDAITYRRRGMSIYIGDYDGQSLITPVH